MRARWAPALLWTALGGLGAIGCGDALFIAEEALPPGTELKVVAWTDGASPGAALRAADDPSVIPLGGVVDAGRTLRLTVFPFTRAELDAAVPGLRGASAAEVLSGVTPTFGGAIRVPGAAPVLEARIDDDSDAAVVYTPVPRAAWDASVGAGERAAVGLTVPDALACRVVQPVDVIDLPLEFRVHNVVAVDGERMLVLGTTGTITFQLLDVRLPEGARAAEVRPVYVPTASLGRPYHSVGWDAVTRSLWGRDSRGTVYRMGEDGQLRDFPPLPEPSASSVQAGIDGTVVAIGARSTDEGGITTYVLAPGSSSWTATPSFRNGPRRGIMRAFSGNRFMADLNCHTRAWEYDRELGEWNWGVERASDSSCTLFLRDVALDASQYIWLGTRGTLRVGHDDTEGVWPEQPHAIAITSNNIWPYAVAAMGKRRFAVAGDRGQLEVWIGDRWCLPEGGPTDVRFVFGSGTDGTAWFMGTDGWDMPTTRARAIRVRIGS